MLYFDVKPLNLEERRDGTRKELQVHAASLEITMRTVPFHAATCYWGVRSVVHDAERVPGAGTANDGLGLLGGGRTRAAVNGVGDVREQHAGIDCAVEMLCECQDRAVGVERSLIAIRGVGRGLGELAARLGLRTVGSQVGRDVLDISNCDVLRHTVRLVLAEELGRFRVIALSTNGASHEGGRRHDGEEVRAVHLGRTSLSACKTQGGSLVKWTCVNGMGCAGNEVAVLTSSHLPRYLYLSHASRKPRCRLLR